jgi:hypothetical protein
MSPADSTEQAIVNVDAKPILAEAAKQRQIAALKKGDHLPVTPKSGERDHRAGEVPNRQLAEMTHIGRHL